MSTAAILFTNLRIFQNSEEGFGLKGGNLRIAKKEEEERSACVGEFTVDRVFSGFLRAEDCTRPRDVLNFGHQHKDMAKGLSFYRKELA
ncbi:hypothetical protein FNV43_RR25892 [Rhamnella rubrinervis]|uniref:Uncharacterized protein n=1 Tax=Rhamnella rubrinervis TaxID=2594499 RepID=A0A8K0DHM1_9ROSA|nr:hypothetical protein FNV43_RR25892 [Rhamnella rubrinervis]